MGFKRQFGESYIKWKIRTGRGSTFTAELDSAINSVQRAGIVALILNTYFHILVPFWVLPGLWIAQKTFEYFMGWFDEKHLRWWHFENEYNSRHLNPWNEEVLTTLQAIKKKLD